MELTARQIKICDLVDKIDSSMNWSLTDNEKDKKIIVYGMGLDGIPDELIDVGLAKHLSMDTREFPTPGQFRALCKPVKRTGHKLLSFEESVRDNELNKKIWNDLLNRLGVKLLKNGKVEKINKDIERETKKLNKIVKNLKSKAGAKR